MPRRRPLYALTAAAVAALALAGCTTEAHTVSDNLSTDAEQFKVERQIVFYNGITDKYVAQVRGRCSVDGQSGLPGGTLAVTCKIGPNRYIKDYLGLSDNVTWFMLQQHPVDASVYHYQVVFKPENVIPDFTVDAGQQ